MIQREKKFKDWLKTKVESPTPLSTYPRRLRIDIPEKLKSIGENTYNNIFECMDIQYLESLHKRLSKNGDLYEFNKKHEHGGIPSASVNKYIYI